MFHPIDSPVHLRVSAVQSRSSRSYGRKGVPGSVSAQFSDWDSRLRLGKVLGFRAPPLYLYAGSA